jgi:hypothetical protein
MTRINLVPPETLHSKHLLAEYRELPRIFGLVLAAQQRGLTPATARIPPEFKLGTGHVTFFYDKLHWLADRFCKLTAECRRRGFNIQHTQVPTLVTAIDDDWFGSWAPRPQDVALSHQRILEKMPK